MVSHAQPAQFHRFRGNRSHHWNLLASLRLCRLETKSERTLHPRPHCPNSHYLRWSDWMYNSWNDVVLQWGQGMG